MIFETAVMEEKRNKEKTTTIRHMVRRKISRFFKHSFTQERNKGHPNRNAAGTGANTSQSLSLLENIASHPRCPHSTHSKSMDAVFIIPSKSSHLHPLPS